MSQAEDLLNGLYNDDSATYTIGDEPHIVVNPDRTITVPESLKHIAVQFDHNIETVTFDCPRYWDGHDFSEMYVYINYMRPDGYSDQYSVKNLRIDDSDKNIIHFEWTISKNVTQKKGNITFNVCIQSKNKDDAEDVHWNSRMNRDIIIDEGMESFAEIADFYPDVIENLLTRIYQLENAGVIAPRTASVDLFSSQWQVDPDTGAYFQRVEIEGITENSQVDLTPSIAQLVTFYDKDIGFVTENDNGEVTVYAVGQKPLNDYTIQVTITEVDV